MSPKPKKLSKSDKIDKEQEARDKETLNRLVPSPHFAVGTGVLMFGKGRGQALEMSEKTLRIRWEDGSVSTIKPYALNR